jgi:hypothetical protein
LLAKDPYNKLLARGPRVRLAAEQVRDQALAVTGLLSNKLYGPSVMPSQPDGIWQSPYSGESWKLSEGEDRYRRALYTYWKRTAPYPSMITFDSPSREFCQLRRLRTNTPLQALVTLNDPVYVEAAQRLAETMTLRGKTPEAADSGRFPVGDAPKSGPEKTGGFDEIVPKYRNLLSPESGRSAQAIVLRGSDAPTGGPDRDGQYDAESG